MVKLRLSCSVITSLAGRLSLIFFSLALLGNGVCRAANVSLGWNASPDPVTGYTVFYGEQSVLTTPATAINAGNVLQYAVAGLTAGKKYYFALKASNANGQSVFSNEVSYTVSAAGTTSMASTLPSTTSTAPVIPATTSAQLTITSTAPRTTTTSTAAPANVTLAWDASPEPVTGYTVFYAAQSVLANPAAAVSKNAGKVLQYTISGLRAGTKYYFALKASNAYGQSGFSTEISYTPPAGGTTPPGSTIASTTSTGGAGASTTTSVRKGKKHLLAGKGAIPPDSQAATESVNAGGDAVTIFDDTEITTRLSVDWDEYNSLNGGARIAAGDIDGDGFDEVVLGLGPVAGNPAIPGGNFQILDDDYTDLGWGKIEWDDYNSANGESWPACGDIDGDRKDEILIGLGIGGKGLTEVFKFQDGEVVHSSWISVGWEEYCEAGGGVRPACGNINADRKDEIILGLYPASDAFLTEGKFQILDGNARHLAWGAVDWPEYNTINGETRPACGDINRTMRDEILIGLGTGSAGRIPVYAYALGWLTLKTWLQAGTTDYRDQNGETRIACGDIDEDGFDEILVGFGRDGQGAMDVHDDAEHDFQLLSRLQLPDDYYNMVNGEIHPAIKGTKSDFPRILNFFLKSLTK